MSNKEFKALDEQITKALEVAEQEMLQAKARRGETLVLWNPQKQQTEHVPAREFTQRQF